MNPQPSALFHFPDSGPTGLLFRNPTFVVTASDVSAVAKSLDIVAEAVRDGAYAAGFVSYEASPAFDDSFKVRPGTDFPLIWFGLFERPEPISYDRLESDWSFSAWNPEISVAEYEQSFKRIADAIAAGETYQVNSTFRLRSLFTGDPLSCYRALRENHPAPYNAFVDTGEHAILSLSPELFFDLSSAGESLRARTQPMKGTMPRGRFAQEDDLRREQLGKSTKDRAENVMIVDLMRNDLGRIAEIGSVSVTSLFDISALPTVFQMTSTVECDLPGDKDFSDVLRALFPAGSITGAPKGQSTKIIAETEKSPRGIYCGTIGYACPDRRAVFNVAIRTVLIDKRTGAAECGVGGGITADSNCQAEYSEAMDKSKFLTSPGETFSLLETLRLQDGKFILADRHRDRLLSSAAFFRYPVEATQYDAALAAAASKHPSGAWRVRLTVDHAGVFEALAAPLVETTGVQRVNVAKSPICVDSPFIYNKTTHRNHYNKLRWGGEEIFDTLLYNERGEITEFTIGNFVARVDGVLCTPSLSCGLLPGTFRAQLIDEGAIVERVLRLSDLRTFDETWFINSVRKWVRVQVAQELA